MTSRFAQLQAAYASKPSEGGEGSGRQFFKFYSIPLDTQAVIRFLPDANTENPRGFLLENLQHEFMIGDKKKRVPCLKMFGKACPLCEASARHYDEGDEKTGKQLYRKKSYLSQIIVVESPIEVPGDSVVKFIDFGPAIFDQITAAFKSGDLDDDPADFANGYNFRIKKTKKGEYANYATSNFAPRQSALAPELVEEIKPLLVDLRTVRGREPDLDYVNNLLRAFETGDTSSLSSGHDTDQDDSTADTKNQAVMAAVEAVSTPTPESRPAAAPTAPTSSGSISSRAAEVMARMKAEQAARAARQE